MHCQGASLQLTGSKHCPVQVGQHRSLGQRGLTQWARSFGTRARNRRHEQRSAIGHQRLSWVVEQREQRPPQR